MTCALARRVAGLFVVAALATGCSPSTATVTGTVTAEGKTVTSGTVSLFPPDNIQRSGMIGSDGSFSIADVPAGTAKIVVTSPNPGGASRGKGGGAGQLDGPTGGPTTVAGWFPLSEKYGSPATTDLSEVIKGPSTVLKVELK